MSDVFYQSSNGRAGPGRAVNHLPGEEIRCQLLWKLARSHGWARWIPGDDLVRTLPRSDRERARRVILPTLRLSPAVVFRPDRGYRIDPDEFETLAYFLRDECGYSELRIEATLSHFDGFRTGDS